MKTALGKLKFRIESPLDLLTHKMNKIIFGKKIANEKKWKKKSLQLKKKYFNNGLWNFNGIKLPELKPELIGYLYPVYMDTLYVYCIHKDNYDCLLIDKLDMLLPEGTYGYKNEYIDVTIKENDVVIDAGAWIGDFSAYASKKGANIIAFEPSKENLEYLRLTKELNQNIQIVEKGLGENSGVFSMIANNSSSNMISIDPDIENEIQVTTIDEFVSENKINKIDFIKADIEGFERKMLIGAKETLKRFGPKLAICTYHLPDDPEVLAKIILDANPNYIIVQKSKKLYAMVNNKN